MMKEITPYWMCVRNVAHRIRNSPPKDESGGSFDAFDASLVLGAAFAKDPGEVLSDIIQVRL